MSLSGPFVLAGTLLLAGSAAAAQTPALRAAAVDDEYRACGPACAKPELAQAESDWLCAEKHAACARVRRANEGLALLADGLKKCGQSDCPPETLAAMCRGSVDEKEYSISDDADQMPGSYAKARLKELSVRGAWRPHGSWTDLLEMSRLRMLGTMSSRAARPQGCRRSVHGRRHRDPSRSRT